MSLDLGDDFGEIEYSSQDLANMVPYPLLATKTPAENVMETESREKLESELPNDQNDDSNTEKIISDILEMENDYFLPKSPKCGTILEILNQNEENSVVEAAIVEASDSVIETSPKRKIGVTEEEITDFVNKISPKCQRINESSDSDSNPSSVQSSILSDDSDKGLFRRRGRPAKPVAALLNLKDFKSDEERRYRELRNKNNEATRRLYRMRRLREKQLQDEEKTLQLENENLMEEVNELEKLIKKFQKAILKL
ncbi:uncharacterized protein LOC134835255 [Culicoides brevitarsis]|uniref:uncharacterized protein LOC134835255 n=1 Tax=Culicoides brevitarsis TaxID=469753 RepID=UPI00307B3967